MLRCRSRGPLPAALFVGGLAAVCTVMAPSVVRAQQRRPAGQQTAQQGGVMAPPPSVTNTLVRNHFESGAAYFQVGRFTDAVREFELAYELSPQPEFLFNLGRARESAGDAAGALNAYERFLAAGAPGFEREARDALDQRMAALRARVAPSPAPRVEPVTPVTPARPVERPAPRRERSIAHVVGSVALFAGGAAAGGVAVWQGLSYSGAVQTLERANRGEQPWNTDTINADLTARRSATLTVAFAATGGALIAGGAVWLAVGSLANRESSEQRARVAPYSDGRSLGVVGVF